eukprot:CAMPEP_0202867708 /NCGR_PEP_ID=MMETSP1391-20130828/9580_1 /ASSEMBLY_ACC=CAM_ASM_000867 /TAXON_ID=1034604 /ORGANISM="Chlamydomonas leiostraca, Strain SAG 11-49" /LENGTH=232 /DNA_ID=CAMNT_0049547771 /DNA_START=6 /DNA_END=701 /DNA_ORIENTATION=+
MSTKAERRALQDQQRRDKALQRMGPGAAEILAVRHGETDWNLGHRLQGQLDPPLNATGRAQAAALAEYFAGQRVHAVWSSDLARAVQTAEALAAPHGLPVATTPGLRERHLGLLQGLTPEEAVAAQPAAFEALRGGLTARIPGGGESAQDVHDRVAAEVQRIAALHPGQRVAVVAHGGVIHALHWRATGRPLGTRVVNASVHAFRVCGSEWVCTGVTVPEAATAAGSQDGFG